MSQHENTKDQTMTDPFKWNHLETPQLTVIISFHLSSYNDTLSHFFRDMTVSLMCYRRSSLPLNVGTQQYLSGRNAQVCYNGWSVQQTRLTGCLIRGQTLTQNLITPAYVPQQANGNNKPQRHIKGGKSNRLKWFTWYPHISFSSCHGDVFI